MDDGGLHESESILPRQNLFLGRLSGNVKIATKSFYQEQLVNSTVVQNVVRNSRKLCGRLVVIHAHLLENVLGVRQSLLQRELIQYSVPGNV
jgi:hypothetical protein